MEMLLFDGGIQRFAVLLRAPLYRHSVLRRYFCSGCVRCLLFMLVEVLFSPLLCEGEIIARFSRDN